MRLLLLALAACSCSIAVVHFDDSLSRSQMMPLSAAAYSDDPQKCLDNQMKTTKSSKQVTVKCDYFSHDFCSGFTFVDEERKFIGVAFRGTSETTQLIVELSSTVFEEKVDFQDGGKTSKYFNDAFLDVWNGGLEDDFLALLDKYDATHAIYITGHSLGAALASMAAAHISSNSFATKDRISLYTFGQPRTGDQKYADIHDGLVTSFRVTHRRDIVAHIPPQSMKYEHHTSEVWYDNDMEVGASYIVCGQQEDKRCSDKEVFTLSADDHLHYYGKDVFGWGLAGCP